MSKIRDVVHFQPIKESGQHLWSISNLHKVHSSLFLHKNLMLLVEKMVVAFSSAAKMIFVKILDTELGLSPMDPLY